MALTSKALLPLAYWYGHTETKKNPLLMERLIRNLGDNIHDRFERDPQGINSLDRQMCLTDNTFAGKASGLILDTPSSFASGPSANDHRHKLIKSCIEALKSEEFFHWLVLNSVFNHILSVNLIVVVGHEKLNVEMQRAYGSTLTVVKIPKSGGVSGKGHCPINLINVFYRLLS